MLSNVFINSASANVSGSENDLAPAYVSEHGLVDAPFSIVELQLKRKTNNINEIGLIHQKCNLPA